MNIYFDIPFVLTTLVFLSGMIVLINKLWLAKKALNNRLLIIIIEYARSFFPVLLLVWTVRSFIIQPYKVPTGSLEPTILPGDFILVNQFAYGLKFPIFNINILPIGLPKRGDIALFRYPNDPSIIFVKRVIGLPGDHIVYKNKKLIINNHEVTQQYLGMDLDMEHGLAIPVQVFSEQLENINHKIFIRDNKNYQDDIDVIVPAKHYFMMGDNRDNSGDSRYWGFMPEKNLVGKAIATWMSWDSNNIKIRWARLGKKII